MTNKYTCVIIKPRKNESAHTMRETGDTMKYEVRYSCGHIGTVELFGTASERENKIRWYSEHAVCPACYKAQKEAECAQTAKDYSLPAQEGSEKQIAWAEKIRAEFIRQERKNIDTYAGATDEQREQTKQALTAAPQNILTAKYRKIVAVFEEPSAKWWI